MSTLVVGTVKNSGTGQPVFRDNTNSIVGQLVQVWVNFSGGNVNSFGIRSSGGVSSVVDNGTGDYTINFSTAFASDGSYCCTAQSREDNNGGQGDHNTYFQRVLAYTAASSIRMRTGTTSSHSDNDQVWVTCIGNY